MSRSSDREIWPLHPINTIFLTFSSQGHRCRKERDKGGIPTLSCFSLRETHVNSVTIHWPELVEEARKYRGGHGIFAKCSLSLPQWWKQERATGSAGPKEAGKGELLIWIKRICLSDMERPLDLRNENKRNRKKKPELRVWRTKKEMLRTAQWKTHICPQTLPYGKRFFHLRRLAWQQLGQALWGEYWESVSEARGIVREHHQEMRAGNASSTKGSVGAGLHKRADPIYRASYVNRKCKKFSLSLPKWCLSL